MRILPLQSHHDTEAFTCGNDSLDSWLKQTARQHTRKGISRTFIAIEHDDLDTVLGFYSLTVGEAETEKLPPSIAKSLPRKIPMALLGRLAVSLDAQGKGIGAVLLIDALRRVVRVSTEVGISVVFVDAKDQNAIEFYEHFDFQRLPDSNRLVFSVKTAEKLVGKA